MKFLKAISIFFTIVLISSCEQPEAIKIGFLGGLSGRVADLGIEGRNGALLAIEIKNKNGGIRGRNVQLIAIDDKQEDETALNAVRKLHAEKVSAIVGPMTSSVAMAIAKEINRLKIVSVSPTVTTNELTGLDDYFFRVVAATTYFAGKSAKYHHNKLAVQRVVAVYDQKNESFTLSWLRDYTKALNEEGGKIIKTIAFKSSEQLNFPALAKSIVDHQSDGILILANSLDAAMLCQHIRRIDNKVILATPEWAATEQLISLGGQAVEGLFVAQFIDRNDVTSSYRTFVEAFSARFGKAPGFAGLTAFEATNVILESIEKMKPGQALKEKLLEQRKFPGVQSDIILDPTGDVIRETYITTVKNGSFITVE